MKIKKIIPLLLACTPMLAACDILAFGPYNPSENISSNANQSTSMSDVYAYFAANPNNKKQFTVTGVVVGFYGTYSDIFYISDGSHTMYVYEINGATPTIVQLGDTLTITGVCGYYQGGDPNRQGMVEIDNVYINAQQHPGDSSSQISSESSQITSQSSSEISSQITSQSSSTSSSSISSQSSSSSSSKTSSSSSSSSSYSSSSSSSSTSSISSSSEVYVPTKTKLKYNITDLGLTEDDTWHYAPSKGDSKMLVVPIWFSESSNYIDSSKKENVRSDIQKAFFGTEQETGWHSVKSFYAEESKGACNISGTVSNWYTPSKAFSYYRSYDANNDYTTDLVDEVVNWYFNNNPSETRKSYDCNGDGFIDSVIMIYAIPNYGTLNKDSWDNLWAYTYTNYSEGNTSNPVGGNYFWSSYDFMYGSSTASSRTGKSYYYGNTDNCTIDAHTFIHETGHLYGMSDYYDYSQQYSPAGGFSMQDCNVGGHDPFSVMTYGWADPYIPTQSCTIEIGSFQSTHDLILLSDSFNSESSPFDEYILLELYTPTGLNEFDTNSRYDSDGPQGVNATGIRIWHVDARLCYTNNPDAYSPTYKLSSSANPYNAGSYPEFAMSNTYYKSGGDTNAYCSYLGSSYYNYNLLQLIRNSTTASHKNTSDFTSNNLFKNGSSFNISTYKSQFVNSTKLNSSKSFSWKVSISISGTGDNAKATITLTK